MSFTLMNWYKLCQSDINNIPSDVKKIYLNG